MNPIYKFLLSKGSKRDKTTEQSGKKISSETGEMIPYEGMFCTDFFTIDNGDYIEVYDAVALKDVSVSFYDANKSYIKTFPGEDGSDICLCAVPENAVYARVSCSTGNIDTMEIYSDRNAYPNYGSDLKKTISRESEQEYLRESIDGDFVFMKNDFDFIEDAGLDTTLELKIIRVDGGKMSLEAKGTFIQTDGEIDYDNRTIKVSITTTDGYEAIINGQENTYDIIKLAPEIVQMQLAKRPLIQVYQDGDNVVSSFVGGTYWEEECTPETSDDVLINDYHFSLYNNFRKCIADVKVTDPAFDSINGTYYGGYKWVASELGAMTMLRQGDRDYSLTVSIIKTENGGVFQINLVSGYLTGDILYSHIESFDGNDWKHFFSKSYTLEPYDGSPIPVSGVVNINLQGFTPYVRYLCDVESINGTATVEVPETDLVGQHYNYKRIGQYIYDIVIVSPRKSAEPTQWGQDADGQYFLPPDDIYIYYPIARSTWVYFSVWLKYPREDAEYEEAARKEYTLKHAYPLYSVIKVMLKEIAPNIKFEATEEYSQFLFSDTNIWSASRVILVTPKTNLLKGEYDQPAQKAEVTFKQIMDMLAGCFQLYWFVDGNKFRIEHIYWFRNGGTYYPPEDVGYIGVDLTKYINPRNGKSWQFGQSKISYEKSNMPERYEFSWMDDVSESFEGKPIEVLSNYVEKGNKKDINIEQFTSDVDYMLYNSESISNDGFALFVATAPAGGGYKLPFVTVEYDNREYVLQNGLASFPYLHDRLWIFNLPGRRVKINGKERRVAYVAKNKIQKIKFPYSETIDTQKLVKTRIGNGQIRKISLTLLSQMYDIELCYDTEEPEL